mmetsp:Transcript_7703/g.18601  ORF Transcript_7703/g.18601 Transcript_7703/m.18601 type:complete len:409 (-) Transcript_7703:483-1709(-)
MQHIVSRYLDYYDRHKSIYQDEWAYDLGPLNRMAPTHAPPKKGSSEREALPPTVRFEMSSFSRSEREAGRTGTIVGFLHGGRPTGAPIPPEVDFLHQRMLKGDDRPASRHDAQRAVKAHETLHPSLRFLQQHLAEKKMLHKSQELATKLKSTETSIQDLEHRNKVMRNLTETMTSRWEDYAEDGMNEIFDKARLRSKIDLQEAEAKALNPEAELVRDPETGEKVPIVMDMRAVPAAKVGFHVHGLKGICHEDVEELPIYPRYSHLFFKECDLVFDFEETLPVVRDVMMRQTGTRPAIERGHRLLKVNHTRVDTLDYPEIVAELTKRPLMLEFEARPPERAAAEISIRNQENAYVGGPEKLFAQRKPPRLRNLESDFIRDVRMPAAAKWKERHGYQVLRKKAKQVLGEG